MTLTSFIGCYEGSSFSLDGSITPASADLQFADAAHHRAGACDVSRLSPDCLTLATASASVAGPSLESVDPPR